MKTKTFRTSKFRVTINRAQLAKEAFSGASGARVANQIRGIIGPRIIAAQERMVDDFENHPVSQEIWEGPSAENTSGLLGGYGNLFSFIGFNAGDDPVSPILERLQETIKYSVRSANNAGLFSITIDVPSKSELDALAPIPWLSGRSWIDGIEKGLSGLGRFLYDEEGFDNSRSGTGLQVKKARSGVKLGGSKYVSKILNDFQKRLARL